MYDFNSWIKETAVKKEEENKLFFFLFAVFVVLHQCTDIGEFNSIHSITFLLIWLHRVTEMMPTTSLVLVLLLTFTACSSLGSVL